MINLLPRELSRQLSYARANAKLMHYVELSTFVGLILAGLFAAAIFYLNHQLQSIERGLAATEQQIAQYAEFEREAKGMADRLTAIKKLEGEQTRFTVLLSDLAAALPRSNALKGITLTGDHSKPVRITVTAPTYESAVASRNAIAASPRIAGADLESVGIGQDGTSEATVTIAFKPGQAR